MATSYSIMISVSLLIHIATQGCCGEDQGLLYHTEDAMIVALREVSQELQRLGNATHEAVHTMQEGLHLQKQNNDALNSLPDMMLQVKEKFQRHKENKKLLLGENEALNKVISLTQELMDMKIQLFNKDQKIVFFKENKRSQEILNLKHQLDDRNRNGTAHYLDIVELEMQIDNKSQKAQDQDNKRDEYQLRIQELEQQVKELNNTVETEKPVDWSKMCEHPRLQEIKQVVQAYIANKDWDELKTGLKAVLDSNSVEYSQVVAGSLHAVGYHNHTQLAFMLLCAGMAVDTADTRRNTLLHGAAAGGHLQLVKQLIDRGAGVSVKGNNDMTPLIFSLWHENLGVVQYLVQAGADTTAKNNDGDTALEKARNCRYTDVVKYLEQFPH